MRRKPSPLKAGGDTPSPHPLDRSDMVTDELRATTPVSTHLPNGAPPGAGEV